MFFIIDKLLFSGLVDQFKDTVGVFIVARMLELINKVNVGTPRPG